MGLKVAAKAGNTAAERTFLIISHEKLRFGCLCCYQNKHTNIRDPKTMRLEETLKISGTTHGITFFHSGQNQDIQRNSGGVLHGIPENLAGGGMDRICEGLER